MAKDAKKPVYYKINSTLKAAHGFNFRRDGKVVKIEIPGKYRPSDPHPASTYMMGADYNELIKPEHKGAPSAFSYLLDQGVNGGIVAQRLNFEELPKEFQKKFDPVRFEKIEAELKKQRAKAAETVE